MMACINRVKTAASTPKAMGVDIDDREIAMTALTELSPKFDNLVSALDSLCDNQNIFSLDFIKGRLLQEEQRTDIWIAKLNAKSELSAFAASCRDGKPCTEKCTHCNLRRAAIAYFHISARLAESLELQPSRILIIAIAGQTSI